MLSDSTLIAQHKNFQSAELGLVDVTITSYECAVLDFSKFLAGRRKCLSTASRCDLEQYLEKLKAQENSPRTVYRKLSSLRRFYEFALSEDLVAVDPTAFIDSPKLRPLQPRSLPVAEIEEMLRPKQPARESPLAKALALRDQAIREVLYDCALRAGELAGMKVSWLKLHARRLRVRGKGNKDRPVPITQTAVDALTTYLRDARPLLAKQTSTRPKKLERDPDRVFLSISGFPLTRFVILKVVRRAHSTAGPHALRHSCATHMVQRGAKLFLVQRLLGHSIIVTTLIYTRFTADQLRATFQKYHPRAIRRRHGMNPSIDAKITSDPEANG
jgi:integrase/recombinase XerD